MTTSLAIKALLAKVAEDFSNFNLLTKTVDGTSMVRTIYDPNLEFKRSAIKSQMYRGIPKSISDMEKKPDGWTLLSWNREAIQNSEHFGIKTYNLITPVNFENITVDKYKAKMVDLPITIKFYSNKGNIIEDIEEMANVLYHKTHIHNYDVPKFGTFTLAIGGFESVSLDKLETETHGSIFSYQLSLKLSYMMMVERVLNYPAISDIIVSVNVGTTTEYEFVSGFKKSVIDGKIERL